MKLDIPLLGRKKRKNLDPKEKKAAEFLSTERGQINDAVDCGPDSGVGITVQDDEADIQVDISGDEDGDKRGTDEAPGTEDGELNLTEVYKDCLQARESYELAMDAFVSQGNKKGTKGTALEPNGTAKEATFEQLEEGIQQVERDIKAAVKNLKGIKSKRKERQESQLSVVQRLRKGFHKFGDNARNIKSYVSLVPKSAGFGAGGLICGGINIILKAAERYVLMDERMENAMYGIREAMVHKAYVYDRHEPDRRMHQLISELFAIIFGVLELLLKWVHQQGTGMALLGAMLKPETYGQDLAILIAEMRTKSGALEKYGRSLEMRELKKTVDAVMGLLQQTQGGVQQLLINKTVQLQMMEKVDLGLEKNTAQVGEVGRAVERGDAAIMAELGELKRQMKQLSRLSRANVVQNLFVFIAEDPPDGWRPGQVEDLRRRANGGLSRPGIVRRLTGTAPPQAAAPRPAPRRRRKAPPAEPTLDAAAVLADVGFNADLVPGDGLNIQRGARLSTPGDQLVIDITSHVRLQALVEVPSSAILLIEGGSNGRHESRGPISVAAARIFAALARFRETNPSLYALAYFCSEHPSFRNGLGGTAMALVITLLLQLIDQHRDFDTDLLREFHEAVMDVPDEPTEDDVGGFCDLLQRCVLALPEEATLFIVVEGIAFFEGPRKRTQHTRLVLEQLLELGSDDGMEGRARVKCLFTTPARSPEFVKLFRPYDVWTVQSVNSAGILRRGSWFIGDRR
ncbi:hypothetical protein QBC47DRAFT_410917 [Echria macrotheca]|uniref:Uncharacterized protein n=1 Tax=Echria macrotheca TaxID=438768 RepID=A0AAJ0FE05_9PEZI|nr:hypothetical protein QBC47DRAFT_410917 [Echria macrotheca]